MIISYLGGLLAKIQIGDFVVAFNPAEKNDEGKPVKFGADLALISKNDPLYNKVDAVTYGAKVPFVIDGPGGGGKIPITPNYIVSNSGGKYTLRNFAGEIFTYVDPSY